MESVTRLVLLAVLAPLWIPFVRALWSELRESIARADAQERRAPRSHARGTRRTPPVVRRDAASRVRKLPPRSRF